MGHRLRELRSRILRSGAAALGWEQIEDEVASRRGGWRRTVKLTFVDAGVRRRGGSSRCR
jgi:hypothetical protein